MKNFHKEEIIFEGKPLSIETGKYAKQADGAVWCKYGDTVVLATVVASKEEFKEEVDFFPLTVDYIEKFYAAGKFPGGFLKRESQPSTEEKLTSRLIDRPIRPLFADWFKNETQVLVTLLSHDKNCDGKIISVMATSAALMASDIPFHGPIAACRVIKKDGTYYINPAPEIQENAHIDIIMAANRDSIVMVEGEANEATEEEMMEALEVGHKSIQQLLDIQIRLAEKVAPVKRPEIVFVKDEALKTFVSDNTAKEVREALNIREKLVRYKTIADLKTAVVEKALKLAQDDSSKFLDSDNPDKIKKRADAAYEEVLKKSLREMITKNNVRIDGRDMKSIRPIWIELGVLPNVHGSAIFTRGETQSLGTLTLGITTDEQRVDTVTDQTSKRFMLHYNFPAFSVGEVGKMKSPGRREIGHGNLAERAIRPLIPEKDKFGYTIRLVSEIFESNGSSSMASVCSGCLSLMDGGVPYPRHVAGIAMGLIKEGNDYAILSDIMGDEDHLGDMDFKVAGSKKGITAIQMDIKIEGLPQQVMKKALDQAKEGRFHIIDIMAKAMPEARTDISPVAPRLFKLNISIDKIRDLIGTGGKNIKSIVEATGANIEVTQDGVVTIAARSGEQLEKTIALVKGFTDEVERGKIYEGVINRIEEYGAFVEVMPGQTGLLHVSRIADERVEKVSDRLKMGEKVKVIVVEVEFGGKFKLSMKPSDMDKDFTKVEDEGGEKRHDRGDRDRNRGFKRH